MSALVILIISLSLFMLTLISINSALNNQSVTYDWEQIVLLSKIGA